LWDGASEIIQALQQIKQVKKNLPAEKNVSGG
jgi:hypothetical protein